MIVFFFFSIVERERRKDAVSERTSLLWPEPRSPSSTDYGVTPNVQAPLKYGTSGNEVFGEVPRGT